MVPLATLVHVLVDFVKVIKHETEMHLGWKVAGQLDKEVADPEFAIN